LYGANDETRLLLRGILRLHRFRVVAEGHSPETLRELPPGAPVVVILDADLEDGEWIGAVAVARVRREGSRFVLLSSSRSPRSEVQARAAGFSHVVRRPFAVHELVGAVSGTTPPLTEPGVPEGPTRTAST